MYTYAGAIVMRAFMRFSPVPRRLLATELPHAPTQHQWWVANPTKQPHQDDACGSIKPTAISGVRDDASSSIALACLILVPACIVATRHGWAD